MNNKVAYVQQTMLKINFLAGFGKILKGKYYSVINVGGLAIAILRVSIQWVLAAFSLYMYIYTH